MLRTKKKKKKKKKKKLKFEFFLNFPPVYGKINFSVGGGGDFTHFYWLCLLQMILHIRKYWKKISFLPVLEGGGGVFETRGKK